MPKRTPSEIYKKAKKAGYPYSYESFRDTDYPNVPEDFHELFGDEIKMFKPKKKKEGGLIGGQKKLDANKDGKISGEDFKILQGSKKGMRMGGVVGFKETESRKTPLKKAEPKNKPLGPTLGKPVGKKGGK